MSRPGVCLSAESSRSFTNTRFPQSYILTKPADFMFSDSDKAGSKSFKMFLSRCFWYLTRDSGI